MLSNKSKFCVGIYLEKWRESYTEVGDTDSGDIFVASIVAVTNIDVAKEELSRLCQSTIVKIFYMWEQVMVSLILKSDKYR